MCEKYNTVKKKFQASLPRTSACRSEKFKKTNETLGNIRLGVKSKTMNLIIPVYKSMVNRIWNATHSFGLSASKEMLHRLEKGNKDDQELRSCCCCTQEGSTKKHRREKIVVLHYSGELRDNNNKVHVHV